MACIRSSAENDEPRPAFYWCIEASAELLLRVNQPVKFSRLDSLYFCNCCYLRKNSSGFQEAFNFRYVGNPSLQDGAHLAKQKSEESRNPESIGIIGYNMIGPPPRTTEVSFQKSNINFQCPKSSLYINKYRVCSNQPDPANQMSKLGKKIETDQILGISGASG